ncbi:transglycosylase family protein [Isoptericola sediminis]|uniref:transglycosylase family protein n=1 Tax=Isoptericola sediminis TaxID=2733572 RepID=UPI001C09AE4D|nr:transglycosylase family protein [Isoptericola sediminis]
MTTPLRRLGATVAAATAVALVPVAGLPATAASAAAAPSTATAAPAAVGPVPTATTTTYRWVKADRARTTVKRSPSSRTIARPDDGTRLVVLDRYPKRLKVRLPDGRVGWVGKKRVTSVPLRDITGRTYTTKRLRVTKHIRTTSRTITYADLGTRVVKRARTTQRDVDRIKVKLPGGRTGWVREGRFTKRDVWGELAHCESGGRVRLNTGNGYYGMYQFSSSTWRAVGGSGLPHYHGAQEQTKRAQILQRRAGWGQWPHCTSKLGLR